MPNMEEMLNDPAAAAEGLQKAKTLDPRHLAELIRAEKDEAEQSTRIQRENWRRYWRLWMSEVDFSGKEDWQTRLWVPKPFTAVEQAGALIQRSLLDSPDVFGLDGFDPEDKLWAAKIWGPLLKMFLNNAKMIYKFSDACKVGFITGVAGYLKLRPTSVNIPRLMSATSDPVTGRLLPSFVDQLRNFIAIDFVLPWNIYRDPDSRPRENYSGSYLYHTEWKDRAAIQAMSALGWNQDAVARLLSGPDKGNNSSYGIDSQRREAELRQFSFQRHKFRKSYLIDEGWLDILDENGDVVFPNALMVHSNGEILYGPVENPIWATDLGTGRRKWPFIAGTPLVHPHRFEGRGLIEQDAGLSSLYSNVFMLWADGLNWLVNPPTEIHQDALVDWEDLDHYPGKLWVKHTSEPALTPAQMGEMETEEIMASLQYIDQQRQNVNFVTDFAVGLPGTRSDITKGEVEIKTSQSLAIFESMGKNLEFMGKDVVELAFDMIVQFFDPASDPSIGRVLGPEANQLLLQLPLEKRVEILQGNYDFIFTGVTQALQKTSQISKVTQFATLAASPGYQGYANPSQILYVLADLLGITDRIDVAQEPMIPQSQVQMMMQEQAAQLTQGGPQAPPAPQPGPPPPSAAPQGPPPGGMPPEGGPMAQQEMMM